MKLLCPDPKIFSSEALELIKKNFLSNIKDLTQSNFNKIGKNYNIIFTRIYNYIHIYQSVIIQIAIYGTKLKSIIRIL